MISTASYVSGYPCQKHVCNTIIRSLADRVHFLREIDPVTTKEVVMAYGFAVPEYMCRDSLGLGFDGGNISEELTELADAYFRERLINFVWGIESTVWDIFRASEIFELPKRVVNALRPIDHELFKRDMVGAAAAIRANIVPEYCARSIYTLSELRWGPEHAIDGLDSVDYEREVVDCSLRIKLHHLTDMLLETKKHVFNILRNKESSPSDTRFEHSWKSIDTIATNAVKDLIGAFCDIVEAITYIVSSTKTYSGVSEMGLPTIWQAGHMIDASIMTKYDGVACRRTGSRDEKATTASTLPPNVVLCISGSLLSMESYMLSWLCERTTRNTPKVSSIVYNFISHDLYTQRNRLGASKRLRERMEEIRKEREGCCNG